MSDKILIIKEKLENALEAINDEQKLKAELLGLLETYYDPADCEYCEYYKNGLWAKECLSCIRMHSDMYEAKK